MSVMQRAANAGFNSAACESLSVLKYCSSALACATSSVTTSGPCDRRFQHSSGSPLTKRCLHTSSPSYAPGKQATVAPTPEGWKWSGNKKEDSQKYNCERKRYKAELAVLRNAWQTHVKRHNALVVRLKARRDAERLRAQEADLHREFARWRSPRSLQTSQERRPDPVARQEAYARHRLRLSLMDAARAAQAQMIIDSSKGWVAEAHVDDAIAEALENEQPLYAVPELPERDLQDMTECVAGLGGRRD